MTTIDDIDLPVEITFTHTASNNTPVLVNDAGHEKVYVGTSLQDLDSASMRDGITRYATVTAQITGFGAGATQQAKAAALGHTYSGKITSVANSRIVVHANTFTGKDNEDAWLTSGWLTPDEVAIGNIQVTYSAGNYSITSSTVTFRVVVSGLDGSGTDTEDFSYDDQTGQYVNATSITDGLTLIEVSAS